MVNFLSHCEHGIHHPVCGVASCGGSFSAHMIFGILGRDVARQALIFADITECIVCVSGYDPLTFLSCPFPF